MKLNILYNIDFKCTLQIKSLIQLNGEELMYELKSMFPPVKKIVIFERIRLSDWNKLYKSS